MLAFLSIFLIEVFTSCICTSNEKTSINNINNNNNNNNNSNSNNNSEKIYVPNSNCFCISMEPDLINLTTKQHSTGTHNLNLDRPDVNKSYMKSSLIEFNDDDNSFKIKKNGLIFDSLKDYTTQRSNSMYIYHTCPNKLNYSIPNIGTFISQAVSISYHLFF